MPKQPSVGITGLPDSLRRLMGILMSLRYNSANEWDDAPGNTVRLRARPRHWTSLRAQLEPLQFIPLPQGLFSTSPGVEAGNALKSCHPGRRQDQLRDI